MSVEVSDLITGSSFQGIVVAESEFPNHFLALVVKSGAGKTLLAREYVTKDTIERMVDQSDSAKQLFLNKMYNVEDGTECLIKILTTMQPPIFNPCLKKMEELHRRCQGTNNTTPFLRLYATRTI